jgi:hypothetical protein
LQKFTAGYISSSNFGKRNSANRIVCDLPNAT